MIWRTVGTNCLLGARRIGLVGLAAVSLCMGSLGTILNLDWQGRDVARRQWSLRQSTGPSSISAHGSFSCEGRLEARSCIRNVHLLRAGVEHCGEAPREDLHVGDPWEVLPRGNSGHSIVCRHVHHCQEHDGGEIPGLFGVGKPDGVKRFTRNGDTLFKHFTKSFTRWCTLERNRLPSASSSSWYSSHLKRKDMLSIVNLDISFGWSFFGGLRLVCCLRTLFCLTLMKVTKVLMPAGELRV